MGLSRFLALSLAAAMFWATSAAAEQPAAAAPPPSFGRGMDHVLLWTREVEEDTAALERLGFQVLPGGTFPDGVANRLVIFPDRRYLELLYFTAPMAEVAESFFEDLPFLRERDGSIAFGIHVEDLEAARGRIEAAGFDVGEASAGTFDPDGPDGPRPSEDSIFRSFGFETPPLPGLDPFFVWYRPPPPETPEWREGWARRTSHPNTARGLSAVWVATADADAARDSLARMGFSQAAETGLPHLGARGILMTGGGSGILLVEPEDEGIAAEALRLRGPHVLGVSVEVADLDTAERIAAAVPGGPPVRVEGAFGEAVVAPAQDALGILVEFHQRGDAPIIDVHKHTSWPGMDDDAYRARLLAEMDREGIALALLHINEPSDVAWIDAAPGRFVAGPMMPCPRNRAEPYYDCFADEEGWPDLAWLDSEMAAGRIGLLGEMLFVYAGVAPDDPRMRPYWELAARHDVPVGVHINRGPPPGAPNSPRQNPDCCPDFDSAMGNPDLLRPVLDRHPGLRIILQHVGAGAPPDHSAYAEETFALLRDYPSVHLDMTILNSIAPAEAHEAELRRLIDAGFGDRIMFGTDNLPAAMILERLEAIEWLTPGQRRAILYDNAARFLRLDEATIARHHGR